MARLVWAIALLLLMLDTGPVVADAPPEDPAVVAHNKAIDEQIDALRQLPIAKEYAALNDELSKANDQAEKKSAAIYERMEKIRQSPQFQAYQQKLDALDAQRQDRWTKEREAMIAAARQIYGERHDELRKLAAPKLTRAEAIGFGVLDYPRMDGSTSTHPLGVIIASRFLGADYEWIYPEPRGSPYSRAGEEPDEVFLPGRPDFGPSAPGRYDRAFDIAAARIVAKPRDPRQQRVAMMINSLLAANSNTHDAFVHLIDGTTDLVINVRGPSDSERKLAAERGVRIDVTPIAKDAVVFIVNKENPTKSLTADQVRAIYRQEIKSWSDLGWETKEGLSPFVRERDSGSRELFDRHVMKGAPTPGDEGGRNDLYSYSMAGPFNQVTTNEGGIGYSVWYYEHFMALSPHTRTLAVDGVEPTAKTIASGAYPFVVPVVAALRADAPPDSAARKMLDWLLSEEGQAIVRESGYVTIR